MYPIDIDLNGNPDPEFDDSLHQSMKFAGYIFPETEEDLDHIIERFSKTKVIIPDELADPYTILARGMISISKDLDSSRDINIDANLAQAAREGGSIENEVKEQMAKDRKAAEDEHRDREAE